MKHNNKLPRGGRVAEGGAQWANNLKTSKLRNFRSTYTHTTREYWNGFVPCRVILITKFHSPCNFTVVSLHSSHSLPEIRMSFKNNKYTNFTPSPPPPSAVLNIPTTTARRKIGNFWFWKVDQVQRFWTRPTLWHNEFPVESPASKGTSGSSSSSSLFQSLWMCGCFLLSYGVCTVKLKVRPWVCVMGINRHSFFRCRWWWRSRRRKIMGQERTTFTSLDYWLW